MNIAKNLNQYKEDYIYYCDPIKNNIMEEGNFIRILYSSPLFVLNGIYLHISINDIFIEKYYNKYKCSFNVSNHREIIESLRIIEDNILKKSGIKNKLPQHKIYEQFINGNIKIFSEQGNKIDCGLNTGLTSFILKISGIWETENSYGVTYKFIRVNHPW